MKRILYILAFMLTVGMGASAQTLIERSDGTFTQGDQYLAALKTLSIPYGVAPTFDGGLARNGSLFFNTTTNKLQIWTGEAWEDVGKETDLSDYYNKSEVNALIAPFATSEDLNTALSLKVDKSTTVNGKALSGNIVIEQGDIPGLVALLEGKVDKTITVNGKALSDNITIQQGDIPGLTSAIGAKQNTITGAATTVVSDNLTANRAVISNGSGKIAASPVTANELSYLGGVTSSVQAQLNDKIAIAQKGANNGVAPLNSSGKIPAQYVDVTTMEYMGTWNASTNVPVLSDATGLAGQYYRVTVGGTRNLGSGSITFTAGDDVIHNGTIWQRVPSTQLVTSVNGQTGNIVLGKTDVGLGNVDNTSDLAKPISNATQTALDGKENTSNKATSFGTLNNTLYPTTQAVANFVGANYVNTTGNQTNILGTKEWMSSQTYRQTPVVKSLTGVGNAFLLFRDADNNNTGYVGHASGNLNVALYSYTGTSSLRTPGGNINLLANGETQITGLAGSGTRMVTTDNNGTLSAAPIPSAQTLSLGALAGSIAISGGNSVNISSLYQTEYPDANSSLGTGVHTRIYTAGSENYPTSTGGGIAFRRSSSLGGAFDIDATAASNDNKLKFRRPSSGTTWNPWQTFASEEWVQPLLNSKLNISGGTVTGLITATTAPTAGGHLTNKTYVDNAISTAIAAAGGKAESVTVAATATYTLSWDAAKKAKFGDFGNFEVWLETGGTYKLATVPVSMTLSGGAASAYTFTLSNVNAIIVIK